MVAASGKHAERSRGDGEERRAVGGVQGWRVRACVCCSEMPRKASLGTQTCARRVLAWEAWLHLLQDEWIDRW